MEDNKARQLLQSCIRMRRNMNGLSTDSELSQGEYYTLFSLRRISLLNLGHDQDVKASDLSEIMHISRPAVTRFLNTLEKKGFIGRDISKDDRRVILVTMTPQGQEAFQKRNSKMLHLADRLVEELGDHDTKKLIELLDKLSNIYEKLSQKGEDFDEN